VDSKARRFNVNVNGFPWTSVDAAWRSTDQEVGGSSPSGRATKGLVDGPFLGHSMNPGMDG